MLTNGTKEIRSSLYEVKTKFDTFIETLSSEVKEIEMNEKVPPLKLEQILSQNSFNFEVTVQSETVNTFLKTLIDIKGTNMIISDH